MPKYGDANTATGQAFRAVEVQTIATALPLPVVTEASLKLKGHPINLTELSGKQEGAMVLVKMTAGGTYSLATATGSLPTSVWKLCALDTDATPVA